MQTILRSKTGVETIISPDAPFVIIGERINPTGRKALAAELLAGNFERVMADALAQVKAGAPVLDVNAGLGVANAHELEPEVMVKAIAAVQSVVDVPLSIDSSVVGALRAGLQAAGGKPLINSVTGESERMEIVFPLVAEYKCAVIAISNDETGISMDPDVRFEVAKKIVQRAESYGIPREDILIDPLVMPVGAITWLRRRGRPPCAPHRRRAGVQHHLRRQQRLLRSARSRGDQRQLPGDADRGRYAQRHHQPAQARAQEVDPGRRHADGPRRGLHALAEVSAHARQGSGSRSRSRQWRYSPGRRRSRSTPRRTRIAHKPRRHGEHREPDFSLRVPVSPYLCGEHHQGAST